MIRQRALGSIRRTRTSASTSTSYSSSTTSSSTSSSNNPLRRLARGSLRGAGAMHFYYGGGTGRSIFTTAAALASAYYVGGLGACACMAWGGVHKSI